MKQSLAVTGSINQQGFIQAIGGVNEKVEGFFDICRHRGLIGSQGCIIPDINVKNLVLRQDVVDAVEQGKFHVYPVRHYQEALEILTGLPAGEELADGNFDKGSINDRLVKKLCQFARHKHKSPGRCSGRGAS